MGQPLDNMQKESGRQLKEDGTYINRADWLYMNQTALGQTITVESTTQFSYKSAFPLSALRDTLTETNGGTVTKQNGAEYRVRATTTAGSVAQLKTKQLGDYVPEHIFLPSIGVRVPTAPTGNAKIQFGYFDFDSVITNGTFVEYNASGVFHKVVSNSEEVFSNEITIDLSDGNIFRFPFLFYGYGFAGLDVPQLTQDSYQISRRSTHYPSGKLLFQNSNLPITCRVESDGAELDAFIGGRQMSVIGENRRIFRATNEVRKELTIPDTTTYVPLVSVRNKTSAKEVFTQLREIAVIADSDMELALFVNGSLTGASFGTPTDYDADEVATDWDNSATAITGGDKIYGALIDGTNKSALTQSGLPELPLVNGDIYSFCLRLISGTNGTATLIAEAKENW